MPTKKVVKEEKEVKVAKAAPKAKAPKAAKPKAEPKPKVAKPKAEPKPKAAPAPQLSKEDVQAAVYAAVKAAVTEVKAAEPKPEVKEEPKKEAKEIKLTGAERLLNFFAYFYLVIGLLASVACVVGGIMLEVNKDSFLAQYVDGPDMGATLIGTGIGIIIPTLVQFAVMKLFVNISHRLTSIDEK